MDMKKVSLDTWIQLLGMLSVLAGLLFVGLEMRQTQRIALATETSNRMYQVVEEIYTTAEIGLKPIACSLFINHSGLSLLAIFLIKQLPNVRHP